MSEACGRFASDMAGVYPAFYACISSLPGVDCLGNYPNRQQFAAQMADDKQGCHGF